MPPGAFGAADGTTFRSIVSPALNESPLVAVHEVAVPLIEQERLVSAPFLRRVNVQVLVVEPVAPLTWTLRVWNVMVPDPASFTATFASVLLPLK